MKKVFILTLVIIFISSGVRAELSRNNFHQEEIIEQQLEKLDLSDLEEEVEKLSRQQDDYLPEIKLDDLLNLFTGDGSSLSFYDLLQGSLRLFFREVIESSRLLVQLIVLAVIAAVLKNFRANFAENEVSKLANTMVYFVLIIIALNSFQIAITIGESTIANMVDAMKALLPVLLSLLIGLGNVTSASLFHPLSYLVVNFLSVLIKNILFPLIFLATILDLVNSISDEFEVTSLASLLKQIAMGLIGLVTTIFGAVILAQGGIAAISDGITIRTAKYLTGSFIPVVGGFISNTLDMIVGGSLLIKNALGFFGVLIIILVCSFSAIKIIALVFIYRFAAAVIQPISEERIVTCLNKLANNLLLVFAAVTIVAIMFFLVLIIMVATANFTVMLR